MHRNLPKFYHFIDNLNIKNIKNFDKKIAIIYRNYQKKPDKNSIIKFKNFCKKKKQKFLISNYKDLVIKYDLEKFMKHHPGGPLFIEMFQNKDATEAETIPLGPIQDIKSFSAIEKIKSF